MTTNSLQAFFRRCARDACAHGHRHAVHGAAHAAAEPQQGLGEAEGEAAAHPGAADGGGAAKRPGRSRLRAAPCLKWASEG